MNKFERKQYILFLAQQRDKIKVSDLIELLQVERTTIHRDIKELVSESKIQEIKRGVYEYKKDIQEYFEIPFFDRVKKEYNPDFLRSYLPNQTFFLSKEQRLLLKKSIEDIGLNTIFYENNQKLLEKILIDISYSSSYLEWNTYSYLDTEVLIKYNEHADDKSEFDANMILNHKRAIEYMIQFKKDLPLTHQTVFELHSLLARDLIDNKYLGVIRNVRVDIGASTYTPLQTEQVLRVELDIFLEKLNQITNPFEQSIFILVFIPYFQLFFDVNKRVSRMLCNLPLLMNNLPLVSLLSIKKKTYIQALLSVYELNDTSLLCKIFVENYMKNAQRYI